MLLLLLLLLLLDTPSVFIYFLEKIKRPMVHRGQAKITK